MLFGVVCVCACSVVCVVCVSVTVAFSFTFLDVVVAQSATIFQLFPRKNESLLIWRDSYRGGQPHNNQSNANINRIEDGSSLVHFNRYLPCPESSPLHSQ